MSAGTLDLRSASLEDFQPLVTQEFALATSEGEPVTALVLTAATPGRGERPGFRAPFSLYFEGPAELPLEQGVYRLANLATGDLDLFLVPIGASSGARQYQAVFN